MGLDTATKKRIARWQATGVAHALWPDLTKSTLTRTHREIWDVTAARLAGEKPQLEVEPLGGARALRVATLISGMGPLLGFWVERGELECDPIAKQHFKDCLDHGRRRAYKMETALTNILRESGSRGITPTVLKGTYTARKYFPEPGTRPSADIDLLVRPEDLTETRQALTAAGLRQSTQPIFGTEVWIPADGDREIVSVEFDHVDNPWSVDLHTSIDRPYFRGHWSQFGRAVFAITERWTVRQQAALVFGEPLLLAHLAQHASREIVRFRIVRLVELILVITNQPRIDWEGCLQLIDNSGIKRFVFPAFRFAEKLCPGSIHPDFLSAISRSAPRGIHKAVERLTKDPLRSFFGRAMTRRLMWTSGFKEKLLGWSDILVPAGYPWSAQVRMVRRRLRMLTGR